MMKTLYELTGIYKDLMEVVEEQGGELTPELEELLDNNEEDLEAKLESYGYVIQNLKQEIEVLNAQRKTFLGEADRINGLRVAREGRVEAVRAHIATCLQKADIRNKSGNLGLKTKLFSFWCQEDHSLEVDDAQIEHVPDKYKRVVYEEYVDKKPVVADWKALEGREEKRDFGWGRIVTKLGLRMR